MTVMPDDQWLTLECQLHEILLQVSFGIPEERVIKSIGIHPEEWVAFKASHLIFPPAQRRVNTRPARTACPSRRYEKQGKKVIRNGST